VTEALMRQLETAPPDRQILLIVTLAERNDDAVLPVLLQTAQKAHDSVRAAALNVLGRAGNVTCVPTLLEIAAASDGDLADAAKRALQSLPGAGVNENLAGRLPKADGKLRRLLIELVGLRRIEAMSELIKAADDSDPQIRSAALAALGSTVGPQNLSVLIQRVAAPTDPQDATAAQQALRAASIRMPDRDECVDQLAAAMSRAPLSAQNALLDIIGSVGGQRALESVAKGARDRSPELRDTASRLLGEWMTADAAPVLLQLAKSDGDEKYKVRALRGYIRIARQFVFPAQERADMCRAALQAATRDAERSLVLEVLEQNPSPETFRLALEAARQASLKDAATKTALAIAQKLAGQTTDIQDLLKQIGQTPVKIEIVEAEYGAGANVKDVTEALRQHVRDLPWVILPSASYNASFGGDPAPGSPKQLKVRYRLNDKSGEVSLPENAAIILPMPEKSS
jgi:HEAT repeat protein